jgi:hypothetical protein
MLSVEQSVGKQKYSEKTYPSTTLFTTNPTQPDLGSNPATKSLSYGTVVCVLTGAKQVDI